MDDLTPWYPPHIKPKRIGVYKTRLTAPMPHPRWFNYWNGKHWMPGGRSVHTAYRNRHNPHQPVTFPMQWRGLKRNSNG